MSELRVDPEKLLGYRLTVSEARENGLDVAAVVAQMTGTDPLAVGDKLGGKAGGKTGGKTGGKIGAKRGIKRRNKAA